MPGSAPRWRSICIGSGRSATSARISFGIPAVLTVGDAGAAPAPASFDRCLKSTKPIASTPMTRATRTMP